MNVLLYWQSGMNSPAIKQLLKKMGVKFCAYFYEECTDRLDAKSVETLIETLPMYAYESFDSLLTGEADMLPLDGKVLEGMRPYAMTAMDIINRWKKSVTHKETYASFRDIYMGYLRYWNNILLTNRIGFVYFQFMPHIPNTYFIYALCKIHGIPIVMQDFMPLVGTSKVNHYFNISLEETNNGFSGRLKENLEKYASGDGEVPLRPELEMYFENYSKEAAKVQNVIYFNEKNNLAAVFKKYAERSKIYITQKRYKILFKKGVYFLKIWQSNKKIQSYAKAKETEPDFSVPFFFFPLHMQPECTTLPCGGVFTDQLEAVRMVSAALPEGYFLYVKEHPAYWVRKGHWESMAEAREKKYYDVIAALKNVRLIRHDYSSLEMTEKCAAVVTIRGTSGFEALFKGKPVLVFAHYFYSEFPGVFRIRDNESCLRAVERIANGGAGVSTRNLRAALKTMEPYLLPLPDITKAYADSGGELIKEEDLFFLVNSIVRFAEENYNISVNGGRLNE